MKPLPAIAAGMLAAFLLLSPAVVLAAAPTVTTDKTAYTGSQTINISGTATPSSGVGLKVTNPSGVTVFIDNVVATSSGTFSDSFAAGGTSNWITGTYTVAATVSSQTGTSTFTYTAAPPPPTGNAFTVLAQANSPVYAGQGVQINAYVYNTANGTAVHGSGVAVTATTASPSGPVGAAATCTSLGSGFWSCSSTLSSTASDGSYLAVVTATLGTAFGTGSTGYTVNSQLANAANQAKTLSALSTLQKDLGANFTALTTAITSAQTAIISSITSAQTAIISSITSATSGLATAASVSSLASSITNVQNTLTSMGTTLSSISTAANTAATQAQAAVTAANNASAAVSSNQTYVLVVAVLAAIVLVLELAILVRKIS